MMQKDATSMGKLWSRWLLCKDWMGSPGYGIKLVSEMKDNEESGVDADEGIAVPFKTSS